MIALKEVLVAGHPIRELEPSLFSALDPDDEGAPYDLGRTTQSTAGYRRN